jgi:uncharacterized membrane protein
MGVNSTISQRLLVLAGFASGALVLSGALGPSLTWPGEAMSVRVLTVFLLPITAASIRFVIHSLLEHRGAVPDPSNAAVIDSIVLCVTAFLMAVHTILLAALLQVSVVQLWGGRAVVVLVGLTTAAVGNLLPRTRPNLAVGLRTRRTLGDRQLWALTHRMTGYLAVIVGAVTVASGLFLERHTVAALPGISFLAGAVALIAYYLAVSRASEVAGANRA